MIKFLAALTLILPLQLFAGVNLATGQFHHVIVDYEASKTKPKFTLWRSYNSQEMQHIGLFGKGWCSNLEYKLISKNNNFTIYHCKMKKITFRNNNKSAHKQGHHLKIHKKKSYEYTDNKGNLYYFNKNGILKAFREVGSSQTTLLSIQKKSISLLTGKSKVKLLKRNKLVTSIQVNKKMIVTYNYRKKLLILSKNKNSKFTSYKYKNNLLVKITNSKGEFLGVSYNQNNAVTKITQNDFCIEKYNYNKNSGYSLTIDINKSCQDGFSYKNKMFVKYNDKFEIIQVSDSYNKSFFSISPKKQKVTKSIKKGVTKIFTYNQQKNLSEINVKKNKKHYNARIKYDNKNRISKITYANSKNKGRPLELKYNKKNQVTYLNTPNKGAFYLKYKKNNLYEIKNKNSLLRYNYNPKKQLKSIQLKDKGVIYSHKINRNNNPKHNSKITGFINSFYSELGELYKDSNTLQELL